jgi:hypothetical protein
MIVITSNKTRCSKDHNNSIIARGISKQSNMECIVPLNVLDLRFLWIYNCFLDKRSLVLQIQCITTQNNLMSSQSLYGN